MYIFITIEYRVETVLFIVFVSSVIIYIQYCRYVVCIKKTRFLFLHFRGEKHHNDNNNNGYKNMKNILYFKNQTYK